MITPAENKVNKNIFLSEAETFKCKNKSGVCNTHFGSNGSFWKEQCIKCPHEVMIDSGSQMK